MATNGVSLSAQFGINPASVLGSLAAAPSATVGNGNGNGSSNASNSRLRKRTKTGCLTCRKRRIKCGEERPTCANCIKSKRHCEGYNQRVVFKPPIENWPGVHGPASTIPYHTATLPRTQPSVATFSQPVAFTAEQSALPLHGISIDELGRTVHFGIPTSGVDAHPQMTQYQMAAPSQHQLVSPQGTSPITFTPNPQVPFSSTYQTRTPVQPLAMPQSQPIFPSYVTSHISPVSLGGQSQLHANPILEQGLEYMPQNFQARETPTPMSSINPDFKIVIPESSIPTPPSTTRSVDGDFQRPNPSQSNGPGQYWDGSASPFSANAIKTEFGFAALPNDRSQWNISHVPFEEKPPPSREYSSSALNNAQSINLTDEAMLKTSIPTSVSRTATEFLYEAATEYEDDDYYDVLSDEDLEVLPEQTMVRLQEGQGDLGIIMALHRDHAGETSLRRFDNFIYQGILDAYRTEWVANPLKNPSTARVFAHFIFATGPTLSIFERLPRNSSAMFSEYPVPNYQQGLWTYTLPMMALNHQGLLHAMLALSSLHISRLQGASSTPSYKHYAYSLKRIHHCVGHTKKRHLPTTLAATLLLGFYEVMTADHYKWCSHLSGASRLMLEIDYRGMERQARKARADQAAQEKLFGFEPSDLGMQLFDEDQLDQNLAVDEELVSTLIGRGLRYDTFGHVTDDEFKRKVEQPFDPKKYQLYQDLFWWYARQDTYQSIIAGNRLLLDYRRWSDCPPRAAVGKADAVYGSHDHLFLLFGRIADFATKDRGRKLRVMAANGGQYTPPQNINLESSPNVQAGSQGPPARGQNGVHPQRMPLGAAHPIQHPSHRTPPQQQPAFFGMAPMPTTVHMPTSYAMNTITPPNQSPTTSEHPYENDDQALATQAALADWNQMYTALTTLESRFGPSFQPFPPDVQPSISTPFGDSIHYPTYDVAVLWALYYTAHIVALRSHPHMHPAATVAASIASGQTAMFANRIGRIAAGMMPCQLSETLNPSLGATLCEVTLPLFFAGVQYSDPHQRSWLISRTRELAARTGWASVQMIAQGCETAWEKLAAAGRGPPYVRTQPKWHQDPREARKPDSSQQGGNGRGATAAGASANENLDHDANVDDKFSPTNTGARVHWAMGILSEDNDLRRERTEQLDYGNMGPPSAA